jgi:hypothetical protein
VRNNRTEIMACNVAKVRYIPTAPSPITTQCSGEVLVVSRDMGSEVGRSNAKQVDGW